MIRATPTLDQFGALILVGLFLLLLFLQRKFQASFSFCLFVPNERGACPMAAYRIGR